MFRQTALLCLAAVGFTLTAIAQPFDQKRMIDLTHTFDETTIYWPTEEGFKLLRGKNGVTEQG